MAAKSVAIVCQPYQRTSTSTPFGGSTNTGHESDFEASPAPAAAPPAGQTQSTTPPQTATPPLDIRFRMSHTYQYSIPRARARPAKNQAFAPGRHAPAL